MKKKEIKKDVILEKILSFLEYLSNNAKKTLSYFGLFVCLVIGFIFYKNNSESKLLSYNNYSSTNQNNFIDGNQELAIIGFDNILTNYDKSESYNQAFIYLLSDAIDNNDFNKIGELIDNNMFSTDDNMMQSYYENIKSNYYYYIGDYPNAVKYCKSAIKTSLIDDHKNKFKINLIYIHIYHNDIVKAKNIFNSVVFNDLPYDLKNKYNDINSRLKYKSN